MLDTCTRLCLLEPGSGEGIRRKTLIVRGNTSFERAEEIKKLGVCVVICSAVSNVFYNLLKERYVDMVCGITGDINEVIAAYRGGTLGQARFRMPGAE
ncbi:NifB/NifX family molybdenum-iron cluster-binding protein [Candidatus Deferrimicrobium sp.]|uniref:NifB/NifX family molybdenum-iron cluster-binding protein n=1 Tax=Candidatus Deferrimicrobium sp. TaxID=3060586 RepID=UPI003C5071EC